LTLVFGFALLASPYVLCWFLTSPPRVHDGGGEVRNAFDSVLCASGLASRAPARSAGALCAYAGFFGRTGFVRAVCGSG
jgi:hypothetical protein